MLTFTVFTATTDTQGDLTSGGLTISTPSLDHSDGHHSGAAHYKYDEEVPQAYEQSRIFLRLFLQTKLVTLWTTTT